MRSAPRTSVIVIFFMMALLPLVAAAPGAAARPAVGARHAQTHVLRVPTQMSANNTYTGVVEGPPPPAGGAPPQFRVVVTLNGWQRLPVKPTFNQETGEWDFPIHIPAGTSDGTLQVTLIPHPGDPVTVTVQVG